MENQSSQSTKSNNSMMYYVLGGVILVLILGIGYMLRPQMMPATGSETPAGADKMEESKKADAMAQPVKSLACTNQYYNPVIGFEKYYLSVEGVDVADASEITCDFSIEVDEKVVATQTVAVTPNQPAGVNGVQWRCSTKELELKKSVPTNVKVSVRNNNDKTAECEKVFLLP